jgi:hypothetical protein
MEIKEENKNLYPKDTIQVYNKEKKLVHTMVFDDDNIYHLYDGMLVF